ncbi:hypothetical protein CDD82_7396 [Ophiocordyceps australis]|uniref:Protein ZIP4 homolog n=1 Tax=Ophiocordyceps australis TaxID=1399860 RepID=A0A2C5YRP9_9HYPO|nr:hypothetical protein CDD82_7396 [Ophiocordyceps australis]
MAPPADPVAVGRERRLRSVIEFASELQDRLPVVDQGTAVDVLVADLGQHLQTISKLEKPSLLGLVVADSATHSKEKHADDTAVRLLKDLEHLARNLWNLCIRIKRDGAKDGVCLERRQLLARARLFAFHAIKLGRTSRQQPRDAQPDAIYLANMALTLAKVCINDADLDSARSVLQQAAEWVDELNQDASAATTRLEAQYLTLRMALSCKQDNLDVAEHMFHKAQSLVESLDAPSAETMADTLQHIGAALASRGNHVKALEWLRRAHQVLHAPSLDKLSLLGLELRMAICHYRIQSLLAIDSPESLQEANDLVAYFESELGDKPVILHWRLDILLKSPAEVFDAEAYASTLHRMIRCFDSCQDTLNFLLHHIKELGDVSARLATGLLDELARQHVLPSGNVTWINKVLVRRIWMATMDSSHDDPVASLGKVLDRTYDALSRPMSPEAAGAAHSLIWKRLEASFADKQHRVADEWCQVALHAVFGDCGEANLGKFGRKRILCALELNDAERARDAFHNMPKGAQDDALSRYLMFKVSLVSWDHELGCESIGQLSKSTDAARSLDMLYACIREAQEFGDKLCTLAALKAVCSGWSLDETTSSNLPSILRCTIRLIHLTEQEDKTTTHEADFAQDTCELFEKAAEQAKLGGRDDQGNKVFTVQELHWFRKNAYNIGATKCCTWGLPEVMRIFDTCLVFVDCYPKDMARRDEAELALMAMRCHFVLGAALVSLARAEDRVHERLQRYREARRHVAAFDGLMQTDQADCHDAAVAKDLLAKMSTLLVFDFEGAACLNSWEHLGGIIRKAKPCRDEAAYKAMGDCLLRSQAPAKVVYGSMRLIINDMFELADFDSSRLAKYLRCVFQAMLPLDDALALDVFDQAVQLAREGQEV